MEEEETKGECVYCGQPCDEDQLYCGKKCFNADLND